MPTDIKQILKMAEGMREAGFVDMEISPEEFCDLLNYHNARPVELNSPLEAETPYELQERLQQKKFDPKLIESILGNPPKKYTSQLTWEGHYLMTEHDREIADI